MIMIVKGLKPLIYMLYLMPFIIFSKNGEKGITELVIGYGDHNAPPYAIERSEKLNAGIIKDIATEISVELDIGITFVKTPRKRIERYLENNTIHLILISNPAWLSNSDKLHWSDTIFIERDKIVVRADNPNNYQQTSDLKGMIIGTIRGYQYPTLQPLFYSNQLIRYDVNNLNVNFIRLALKRVDALVDAETLINYQFKTSKNPQDFKALPFIVSQQKIKAALSPKAPITIVQLNRVLNKLKKEGVIAAIFEKYQLTH